MDEAFQVDVDRFNASIGLPTPAVDINPPGIYNTDPLLDDDKRLNTFA